jgi:hypothetical protein
MNEAIRDVVDLAGDEMKKNHVRLRTKLAVNLAPAAVGYPAPPIRRAESTRSVTRISNGESGGMFPLPGSSSYHSHEISITTERDSAR